MKIKDFSRDGVLKLRFNQKLIVPDFIKRRTRKLSAIDLEKLKVREDILDIKIVSKSLQISNYTLHIQEWTTTEMDIKFDFEEPLVISQKELDQVECKVINPFLFVSEDSGGYLMDYKEVMVSKIPKQLPLNFDAESVQKVAEIVEQVSKWIMFAQLITQLCLKGSIEQILSLYYTLQMICYIYNIH